MRNGIRSLILGLLLPMDAVLYVFLLDKLPPGTSAVQFAIVAGLLFLPLSSGAYLVTDLLERFVLRRLLLNQAARRLLLFTEQLRNAHNAADMINLITTVLEQEANLYVIWMERSEGSCLHCTSDGDSLRPERQEAFRAQFADEPVGACYVSSDNLERTSPRRALGICLVDKDHLLFVFAHQSGTFSHYLGRRLFTAFGEFLRRLRETERIHMISAVTREWEKVTGTQRWFLPEHLPRLPGLEVEFVFRPLVQVSGDYYDVLQVDERHSLLLLGDVAGKGLPAALIMGIVINTLKLSEDKTNLEQMVRSVDSALKDMGFDDKFSALFVALFDHQERILHYVNAGMPDALILSGRSRMNLPSNCPLLGVINLPTVTVDVVKLSPGDVLIIGSDGFFELESSSGEELYGSERFYSLLRKHGQRDRLHLLRDKLIVLAEAFQGKREPSDDLTLLLLRLEHET